MRHISVVPTDDDEWFVAIIDTAFIPPKVERVSRLYALRSVAVLNAPNYAQSYGLKVLTYV